MMKKLIMHRRNIACLVAFVVTVCSVLTPFMGIETYSAPSIEVLSDNFQKTDTVAELKGETNLLYEREFTKVFLKDGSSTNTSAYGGGTNKKSVYRR